MTLEVGIEMDTEDGQSKWTPKTDRAIGRGTGRKEGPGGDRRRVRERDRQERSWRPARIRADYDALTGAAEPCGVTRRTRN